MACLNATAIGCGNMKTGTLNQQIHRLLYAAKHRVRNDDVNH